MVFVAADFSATDLKVAIFDEPAVEGGLSVEVELRDRR
jgi:hypothetical protein